MRQRSALVLPPAPGFCAPAGGTLARRTLGRTKLDVTIMTLGTAPFGIADDVPAEEGVQIVREALEAGVNFIDTAPKYGKSEEVVGQARGGTAREHRVGHQSVGGFPRRGRGVSRRVEEAPQD